MKTVFGETLKSLREELGITQSGLARILNVSRSSVANYEAGVREPDIACIKDMADFFKVSVDYLLGRSSIKFCGPEDERIVQLQKLADATEYENLDLENMELHHKAALLDFYRFLCVFGRLTEDDSL